MSWCLLKSVGERTPTDAPQPMLATPEPPSLPSQPAPSLWTTILPALVITVSLTLVSLVVGVLAHTFWQGLLTAGVCLLALTCIAFIHQVVLGLQQLWVEETALWVDRLVRRKWVRYRQYYARFLTFQHHDFDIKGLSTQSMYTLELEQVFVDLRLDPKAPHEANVDPLAGQPSAHLLAGQHAIWWYLEAEALQHQHLILLGPPGSGKTTLLKHLALTLVHPQKRRTLSRPLQRAYHTPFLLFLREHAQAIQNDPTFSLVKAIESRLADWDRAVPPGWVQHQLSTGKCLILLDGLWMKCQAEITGSRWPSGYKAR